MEGGRNFGKLRALMEEKGGWVWGATKNLRFVYENAAF